jgi:hypothetical protein
MIPQLQLSFLSKTLHGLIRAMPTTPSHFEDPHGAGRMWRTHSCPMDMLVLLDNCESRETTGVAWNMSSAMQSAANSRALVGVSSI